MSRKKAWGGKSLTVFHPKSGTLSSQAGLDLQHAKDASRDEKLSIPSPLVCRFRIREGLGQGWGAVWKKKTKARTHKKCVLKLKKRTQHLQLKKEQSTSPRRNTGCEEASDCSRLQGHRSCFQSTHKQGLSYSFTSSSEAAGAGPKGHSIFTDGYMVKTRNKRRKPEIMGVV